MRNAYAGSSRSQQAPVNKAHLLCCLLNGGAAGVNQLCSKLCSMLCASLQCTRSGQSIDNSSLSSIQRCSIPASACLVMHWQYWAEKRSRAWPP